MTIFLDLFTYIINIKQNVIQLKKCTLAQAGGSDISTTNIPTHSSTDSHILLYTR